MIHFSAGIFLKQIPGSEKPLDNSISNNTDIINNSTLTFHYYFYIEISKCYVHYTSQILEEMGQFYKKLQEKTTRICHSKWDPDSQRFWQAQFFTLTSI